MNKKAKEPFLTGRAVNLGLGVIILALILVVALKETGTEKYQVMIFGLAAVENFIAATISFSESKKVRGNLYAVICAVFSVAALILAAGVFGVL